ncbi:MAG: hypothetical protein ABW321_04425, partial [Polyangiales bacterium]
MNNSANCWILAWQRCAITLVLLGLGNTRVQAHGGPPAALGVVAADATGPRIIALNEGLALREEDTWSFMCPRLWGDPDTAAGKTPLALSSDGESTFIAGADDLYLERSGQLQAQGRPELTQNQVFALAAQQRSLVGLRVTTTGSELTRIEAASGGPLWRSDEIWSSLASDADHFYLANLMEDKAVRYLTLNSQGETVEETRADVERVPFQIRLQPTAQGLYAIGYDSFGYTLSVFRSSWLQLLQSPGVISGPQAVNGGPLWLAVDGKLLREAGDHFEPTDETRYITCVGQWGDLTYACAGAELYRLGAAGLEERLFTLAELYAPNPGLISADASQACEFQWILFKNDLTRSGLSPRERNELPGAENTAPTAGGAAAEPAGDPTMGAAGEAAPAPSPTDAAVPRDGDSASAAGAGAEP